METVEPSESDNRAAKAPKFSAVLGSASQGTAIGSTITAAHDWSLDQWALLRWADDGGWVDASNAAIQEARI
jgi:hypothetical protein